jgi:hypothetical protein
MTLFKRKAKIEPMTKGKALIEARALLGPQASVRYIVPENGPVECIMTGPEGQQFFGNSWEQCLRDARKWLEQPALAGKE